MNTQPDKNPPKRLRNSVIWVYLRERLQLEDGAPVKDPLSGCQKYSSTCWTPEELVWGGCDQNWVNTEDICFSVICTILKKFLCNATSDWTEYHLFRNRAACYKKWNLSLLELVVELLIVCVLHGFHSQLPAPQELLHALHFLLMEPTGPTDTTEIRKNPELLIKALSTERSTEMSTPSINSLLKGLRPVPQLGLPLPNRLYLLQQGLPLSVDFLLLNLNMKDAVSFSHNNKRCLRLGWFWGLD